MLRPPLVTSHGRGTEDDPTEADPVARKTRIYRLERLGIKSGASIPVPTKEGAGAARRRPLPHERPGWEVWGLQEPEGDRKATPPCARIGN